MLVCSAMAIKGEVHVKSMVWAPKISLNDGRYVIRPFECKIVGRGVCAVVVLPMAFRPEADS